MTTTTEETWIDVMPAIPLQAGAMLTVLGNDGITRYQGVCLEVSSKVVLVWFRDGLMDIDCLKEDVRVDLSTANGFGYALRWLARTQPADRLAVWMFAWVRDEVVDADRLALAKACREVS